MLDWSMPKKVEMDPILGFSVLTTDWFYDQYMLHLISRSYVKGRSKSPKTKNNFVRYTDSIVIPLQDLHAISQEHQDAIIESLSEVCRMSLEHVMRNPYWRIEKARSRRINRYLRQRHA